MFGSENQDTVIGWARVCTLDARISKNSVSLVSGGDSRLLRGSVPCDKQQFCCSQDIPAHAMHRPNGFADACCHRVLCLARYCMRYASPVRSPWPQCCVNNALTLSVPHFAAAGQPTEAGLWHIPRNPMSRVTSTTIPAVLAAPCVPLNSSG